MAAALFCRAASTAPRHAAVDADRAREAAAQLHKVQVGVGAGLGLETAVGHHAHRLQGVGALGSLPREHHTVGSIQYCIGYVAHLCPSRARIVGHTLKHLGGADHRLSHQVALRNHHLLCHEHLLGGDFDAEIAARHHDAITGLQKLSKVAHTLVVFNLGDDLDLAAVLTQHVPVCGNVRGLADEAGKHHVHALFHPEAQVGLVLIRERGRSTSTLGRLTPFLELRRPSFSTWHSKELSATAST